MQSNYKYHIVFKLFSTQPNIIITTSHDLRVKIFSADTGAYIDELKQISNKYNSVPIGIKYREMDPISSIL